jgi:predicted SAM-dependent methyltransferase
MRARSDSVRGARRKARRYLEGRRGEPACLNLGCGPKPLAGWLNVDQLPSSPGSIVFDLRRGLPMLDDTTVDVIYHEHFFEHLDRRSARRLLQECFRVLRKGGRMRVAMPDLDRCVRRYLEGWADQDNEFIEVRVQLYGDQLLGTPGEGLDLNLRGWGHQFLYSGPDLVRMLELNGFEQVERVPHGVSAVPCLNGRETRSPEQSALIVEARK